MRAFYVKKIKKGLIIIKTYYYVRVSSAEQNENRQLDAAVGLNIPAAQIFIDKQSGKDFNRPSYKSLLRRLRAGDLLYIKSIDRLGRNYSEILENWRIITKDKDVDIAVLDMPLLDTRVGKDLVGTLISDIVLALLSYVSETELNSIRQRQAEGIAAAKARGVKFGRTMIEPPDDFADIVKLWEKGKISFDEVKERTGLKRATFYNRLREFRHGKKPKPKKPSK